jgi:hypothetical protein
VVAASDGVGGIHQVVPSGPVSFVEPEAAMVWMA